MIKNMTLKIEFWIFDIELTNLIDLYDNLITKKKNQNIRMVYNCITVLLSFDFQNDYIESFNLESTSFNSLKNKKTENWIYTFSTTF